MKPIRVLLVDDHDLVRAGLRSLIQMMDGIEVVGEAGTGREALRLVEAQPPDVVLMDFMMPEMNGLDACARLVAKFPDVRVIILSMNASEEHVLQSLRAGASGYLLKNISLAELEQALRDVAHGQQHITPAVNRNAITELLAGGELTSLERLTSRQREVLQLLAEGNSTKEIARKLHVSSKTVESHRVLLMDQLGIYDVPGLVRYAIRNGVVSADL